jgi:hypothetical protein
VSAPKLTEAQARALDALSRGIQPHERAGHVLVMSDLAAWGPVSPTRMGLYVTHAGLAALAQHEAKQ